MSIRTIQPSESLLTLWEELVYTEARLLNDARAKSLAADVTALLNKWPKVNAGQLAAWRAEIVAQAAVDQADDVLDASVDEVDHAILHVDRDRDSPRYRRYFTKPRNEIIRMGLESELERVRTWPASLAGEPEKELKQLGKRLAADVKAGDAAVTQRSAAAAATADHRLRKIVAFVGEVNGARNAIYGELIKRGEKHKLGKGWAERFFRKSTASAKPAKGAPADAANGAPADGQAPP